MLYFVDGHERINDRVIGFGNRPGRARRHHRQASALSRSAPQPTATARWRTAPIRSQLAPAFPAQNGSCLGGNDSAPLALNDSPLCSASRLLRQFRSASSLPSIPPASACLACRFSVVRWAPIRRPPSDRVPEPTRPMTTERRPGRRRRRHFRGFDVKASTLLFGVWLALLTVAVLRCIAGSPGRLCSAEPVRKPTLSLALDDSSTVEDASLANFRGIGSSRTAVLVLIATAEERPGGHRPQHERAPVPDPSPSSSSSTSSCERVPLSAMGADGRRCGCTCPPSASIRAAGSPSTGGPSPSRRGRFSRSTGTEPVTRPSSTATPARMLWPTTAAAKRATQGRHNSNARSVGARCWKHKFRMTKDEGSTKSE